MAVTGEPPVRSSRTAKPRRGPWTGRGRAGGPVARTERGDRCGQPPLPAVPGGPAGGPAAPLVVEDRVDHGVAPGAPGPQVPADTPLLDHSGAEHDPPRRLVAGRAGAPDALQFEAVESEAEQEVHRLRAEAPAPQVGAEREADLRAVRTLVNDQSRSPRNTVVVGRHGEHVHGPRVSVGVSDCALDDGAALLSRVRAEVQVPDGYLGPVHPHQVYGVGGAELPQPEAVTGHIDTHVPSLTSCREGRDGVLTVRLDLAPRLRHCAVSVVLGLPQSTVDTHHTGDNARRTLLDRKSQNRGERLVGSLDLPLADPCETQVSPCPRLIPVSPIVGVVFRGLLVSLYSGECGLLNL